MLGNRLRRTYRHLRKWAKREEITCFRLYEKDIPDQPLIVDWYDGRVVAYAMHRKKDETPEQRAAWLEEVHREILEGLDLEPDRLYLKERRRQRVEEQYRRLDRAGEEFVVREHGHQFLVNLNDFLDTGLFLDHRITRRMVQEESGGKRVLNLFCYTGSFQVYASAGGATSSLGIDLSNTYLDWAERNLELNQVSPEHHRLLRDDILLWLPEAVERRERFDLIVCDPPTFSNSKKMQDVLDLAVDHPVMINHCLKLLNPEGVLYFSTNDRGFKLLEEELLPSECVEISSITVPEDFRNRRIHRCWRFRKDAT